MTPNDVTADDMTADDMAHLHALCMRTPAPWGADAFRATLSSPGVIAICHAHGFALLRTVLDEAELLTIAVHPDHQKQGIGARLLDRVHQAAQSNGAVTSFLEVAAGNLPATRLYRSAGYAEIARRAAYFMAPDGHRQDALVMRKSLVVAAQPSGYPQQ